MKIGAGWVKDTKDGKSRYMSCVMQLPFLGEISFVMYRVTKKEKESQPDYEIHWFPDRDRPANGKQEQPAEKFEDDIPF